MSEDAYKTLFERIRERCRQLHWYGPDDENINWVEERYDPASDHGGRLHARLDANAPHKLGFAYPPATRVGVTKEEGHLISLQAPSLQKMLERWLQLPYDSPVLLRGY